MAGKIDKRIEELGLTLPQPIQIPPGLNVPLVLIKQFDKRLIVAGHSALNDDGSIAGPFGRVGEAISIEDATEAARRTALAMTDTIKREIGDLDTVKHFVKVLAMINSAADFTGQSTVANGFSEQLIQIFGEDIAKCPRSAVGMGQLPYGIPVEIEAEVELR